MIRRTMTTRTNTNFTKIRPEGEQGTRLRAHGEDTQQTGAPRGRLISSSCNRQGAEGVSSSRWHRTLHLLSCRQWF